MTKLRILAPILALMLWAGPVHAEPIEAQIGGDLLAAGGRVEGTGAAPRDLLITGGRVLVNGPVAEDLYASGFSIDIAARVGADANAAGAQVTLGSEVGGDAVLAGAVLTVSDSADVAGNLRLFGASVTMDGAVSGALLISAGEARLNGPVSGDVMLNVANLSFGPEARIDGQLTLATSEDVDIPTEVIPSGRVTYVAIDTPEWREFDELAWEGMPQAPSAAALAGGYLISLAFLLAVGAAFLALVPGRVASMRRMAIDRPGLTILLGFIGFSTLVGLVPVSAMTIIGLPLLPMAILTLILAWVLGYLLGAYVLAMAIARAAGLGDSPSLPIRIAVLAAAITGAALLNFIPFLGWIGNVALVFLGIGAMTEGLLRSFMPGVEPSPDNEMLKSEKDD